MHFFWKTLCITLLFILKLRVNADQAHSNYAPKEDMKEYIKAHFNLTDEEYHENDEYYYLFYMNDYDKDQHLDGHEIRHSFHTTQVSSPDLKNSGTEIWSLEKLNKWVDQILMEDDIDGDGLISLSEYLASQAYHKQKT